MTDQEQAKAAPKPRATKPAAEKPRWPTKPVEAVAAKLAHLQGVTKDVQKDATHKQGYKYFQEHSLIEQLKPLLRDINASITFGPESTVTVVPKQIGQNPNGNLTTFKTTIVFRCGDTGGTIEHAVIGQGEDTSDKGAGKAMTYAFKYGLQKLGLIPTQAIHDADDDNPDVSAQAPRTVTGQAPAVSPDPTRVDPATARQLAATVGDFVQQGLLDPNKVTGMLATYRTDDLTQLTPEQFEEFGTWCANEAKKTQGG